MSTVRHFPRKQKYIQNISIIIYIILKAKKEKIIYKLFISLPFDGEVHERKLIK